MRGGTQHDSKQEHRVEAGNAGSSSWGSAGFYSGLDPTGCRAGDGLDRQLDTAQKAVDGKSRAVAENANGANEPGSGSRARRCLVGRRLLAASIRLRACRVVCRGFVSTVGRALGMRMPEQQMGERVL